MSASSGPFRASSRIVARAGSPPSLTAAENASARRDRETPKRRNETAVASDDRPKREFAGPAPSAPKSFRGDWKPQTSLRHNFQVAHPPDEVWNYFGRVAEVASCLPGVTLDGEPKNGRVEGGIRVKVGPISADFRGVAEVARDEATRTGEILGSGQDARSHSTTMGSVRYSVLPGPSPGTTNVDLVIGYTLTGMLAQFGRSGLVQDVASRLIAAFAAIWERAVAFRTRRDVRSAARGRRIQRGLARFLGSDRSRERSFRHCSVAKERSRNDRLTLGMERRGSAGTVQLCQKS